MSSKQELCAQVYAHDLALWDSGLVFAGIDEAGRGPLAGCVMTACVVMPREPLIYPVYDSKKLTQKQRECAFEQIRKQAVFVGLGWASVKEIDEINILQATKLAMRRSAQGAPVDLFLIDAVTGIGLSGEERAVIGGDAASYSIAAASIIAKVTRDREMEELDALYPQYGFKKHKGYGTEEHIRLIREFGPCPAHRNSFLGKILSK